MLGYESSLLCAILASLAAIERGVARVQRARKGSSQTESGPFYTHGTTPTYLVFSLWRQTCIATLFLCFVPLVLLLANGLRVRNCNYFAGFLFYLLLPVLSAAISAAVGVVAGLFAATRARALCVGYGVFLVSIAWAVLRALNSPAVFAYDPFFGYFPGALYDEEVRVEPAFFWARLEQLLFALSALFCAARFVSLKEKRLLFAAHKKRLPLVLALGCFLGGQALFWQGGRLGLCADEASVALRLPGRLETPHFVLRYRPGGKVDHDLALYAREHELRFQQLRDLLGVEPSWKTGIVARLFGLHSAEGEKGHQQPAKIVSYLFDSPSEKRRGMGASHTYIAKPWRREIYLHHEAWPHSVLRHELAHVFAGAAGDSVFHLSWSGVWPQQGLIEGVAVAADHRMTGNVSLHQSVLAMQQTGLLPPLEHVFSGMRFFSLPSSRAYTVAGSFIRFLLEQHGPEKVLAVYRSGGSPADFARVYGRPFSALKQDWFAFVASQPLPKKAKDLEQERFRRPAVFHKVCAHDLAVRRERAFELLSQGRDADAVAVLQTVCHDDPAEPNHLLDLAEAEIGLDRLDSAKATLEKVLSHSFATQALRGRVEARLGDIAVLNGRFPEAKTHYEAALALPHTEAQSRTLLAKQTALSSGDAGLPLLSVLTGRKAESSLRKDERSEVVNAYLLSWAAEQVQPAGLPRYLLGRLLFQRGGYKESITELRKSTDAGLPDFRFVYQAKLLIGQAQLLLEDAHGAKQTFSELLLTIPPDDQDKREEVADFVARASVWSALPGPLTSLPPSR